MLRAITNRSDNDNNSPQCLNVIRKRKNVTQRCRYNAITFKVSTSVYHIPFCTTYHTVPCIVLYHVPFCTTYLFVPRTVLYHVPFCTTCRVVPRTVLYHLPFCNVVPLCHVLFCDAPFCNIPGTVMLWTFFLWRSVLSCAVLWAQRKFSKLERKTLMFCRLLRM